MANPGEMAQELAHGAEAGRFFTETFLWHRDNAFERFVRDSPAAALAAQVMRATRMNIVFDQFLIKEPGTDEPTVWHHDLTYWPIRGDRVATLWLALDEVTERDPDYPFILSAGERRSVNFKTISVLPPRLPWRNPYARHTARATRPSPCPFP